MFVHHTFRPEMSYLNRKSKSICHHWCHRLSAPKKRVDLQRLQRPSLWLPDPKPATCRPPWQLNKLFFKYDASQTHSCTHFSRLVVSLGWLSRARYRAQRKVFPPFSFWRRLQVGDGARLDGAASRFQPCLDCHIVWPCMSESTESSACPESHHAPVSLPKTYPKCAQKLAKMCAIYPKPDPALDLSKASWENHFKTFPKVFPKLFNIYKSYSKVIIIIIIYLNRKKHL